MAASAVAIACAVALGVRAGQDVSWDLRNYHLWAAFALLHGRHRIDVAPAQLQTWLNPIPYVVPYLLIRAAPPLLANVVLSAAVGLSGAAVYALARRVLAPGGPTGRSVLIAGLATALGLAGPMVSSQLGGSSFDTLGSLLVLPAVWLCASAAGDPGRSPWRHVGSGLLVGLATGAKWTFGAYAVGIVAASLVACLRGDTRPAAVGWVAAGLAGGAAASGGYWAWRLWQEFGNPVFPFYNGVFGSRFYPPVDFHDARFLPGSLGRALLYPFLWAVGRHPTAEVRFRDARFALIAVLAVAAVATVGVRRLRSRCGGPRQPVLLPAGWVLAVFFVASYATWLRLWAIQRYLATLELLSGVVIAMLVGVLVRRGREGVAILAAVTAGTIAWTIPPSWGRRPFDASWFAVQTTGPAVAPGTLWLIASGGAPVSYVLTELPRDGRAVRLSGNMPLGETSGFWSRTRAVVAEHQGPVRTLTAGPRGPSGPERATVQRLGLEVDDQACDTFRSNFEPFVTCPVRARPARGGRRRAT